VDRSTTKTELLELCSTIPSNGVNASEETKAEVRSIAKRLVETNPTAKPASSGADNGALDGLWELIYTDVQGQSSGKLGPFIGFVTQEVKVSRDLYKNNVELGPLKLALSAKWDVLNDASWKVIFIDLVVSLFNIQLLRKEFPTDGSRYGFWRMGYVDKDTRVLYTSSASKKGESVFVLTKICDDLPTIS
jgi:hypothetical protein